MEIAIIVAIAVVAIGVVLFPLLRKSEPAHGAELSDQAIDEQVARYRSAIKNGTLCDRCLAANPAGSHFCAECGRAL